MSKGRLLITILISTLMGFGALMLANNWLEEQQANLEPVKAEPEQVEVVREVIKEVITSSGFEHTQDVVGKVVKNEILAGEVIRKERLVNAGEGTTLAALISPNMRAVTIRVNDVIGVAGFLLPGDYVDVIYARKNVSRAQTVLKRIKILAVDQTAKTNASDPIIVRAVTLELTPRQAESLVTAKSKGELQLSLRNPNDPIEKPRVYRKTTDSVTIIKGTESSRVNVKI